jgi:hypothetical protein
LTLSLSLFNIIGKDGSFTSPQIPENDDELSALEVASLLLQLLARFATDSMPLQSEDRVVVSSPHMSAQSATFVSSSSSPSSPRNNSVLTQQIPPSAQSLSSHSTTFVEPFCIDLHSTTFELLCCLLHQCKKRMSHSVTYRDILLSCLRLLKVNLHRLLMSNGLLQPSDVGLVPPRSSFESETVSSDDDTAADTFTTEQPESLLTSHTSARLTLKLRELLLYFIAEPHFANIQSEASDVLTVGLPLFYPSHHEQALFLLKLLTQASETPDDVGVQLLLQALFTVLTTHVSPSYLVLPPGPTEQQRTSNSSTPRLLDEEDAPLDPLHLFVPLISRLLKESHSSSPIVSPILHLLRAIQRDLLLRTERHSESGGNELLPAKALVIYVKLVFAQCRDTIDRILHTPQQERGRILNNEVQNSLFGILLPSLVHSLFLFVRNAWLARQTMSALLELVSALDQLNLIFSSSSFSQTLTTTGPLQPHTTTTTTTTLPSSSATISPSSPNSLFSSSEDLRVDRSRRRGHNSLGGVFTSSPPSPSPPPPRLTNLSSTSSSTPLSSHSFTPLARTKSASQSGSTSFHSHTLPLHTSLAGENLPTVGSVTDYYSTPQYQVVESTHPYTIGTDSKVVVRINGALYLSILFDERCATVKSRDYVQLYTPHIITTTTDETRHPLLQHDSSSVSSSANGLRNLNFAPFGERYSGVERTSWPRRRLLVPGDTVLIYFHTESTSSSSLSTPSTLTLTSATASYSSPTSASTDRPSTSSSSSSSSSLWGYRCLVVGHFPERRGEMWAYSWCYQLELTLSSLVAQFAATLIRGDPLTQEEMRVATILKSDLLREGLDEKFLSRFLSSSPSSHHEQHLPSVTWSSSWTEDRNRVFCEELIEARNEGWLFAHWLQERYGAPPLQSGRHVQRTERAVVAAMLWHSGLVDCARQWSTQLISGITSSSTSTSSSSLENNSQSKRSAPSNLTHSCSSLSPPSVLTAVCDLLHELRTKLHHLRQETITTTTTTTTTASQTTTSSSPMFGTVQLQISSDDTVTHHSQNRVLFNSTTFSSSGVVDLIHLRARFLLGAVVMPRRDTTLPTTEDALRSARAVLSFVLSSISLGDLRAAIRTRRSRALNRAVGLQSVWSLLTRISSTPIMKHEALALLGTALRASTGQSRVWPYHYLDDLEVISF